jgi:dynein heavy chain
LLPLPHPSTIKENDTATVLALESAIVDWTYQIRRVIRYDSAAPIKDGLFPGPSVELDFWAAKEANLTSIHEQLSEARVERLSKLLEASQSTYLPAFKALKKEVTDGNRFYRYILFCFTVYLIY